MKIFCLALLAIIATPATAKPLDRTPRTLVMTAFAPEWESLAHSIELPKTHRINGLTFLTGTMAGKPVLLMQSGMSMVNAAMNTQLELACRHLAFPVDPGLLTLARKVATGVTLRRSVTVGGEAPGCLAETPKIVVGGTGVSASVYADNAEFRSYLTATYRAGVLDMESAAVAQVAYVNTISVIVFRSLSDLAGGDAGANQMTVFMTLAAANSATVVRAFVAALPN